MMIFITQYMYCYIMTSVFHTFSVHVDLLKFCNKSFFFSSLRMNRTQESLNLFMNWVDRWAIPCTGSTAPRPWTMNSFRTSSEEWLPLVSVFTMKREREREKILLYEHEILILNYQMTWGGQYCCLLFMWYLLNNYLIRKEIFNICREKLFFVNWLLQCSV